MSVQSTTNSSQRWVSVPAGPRTGGERKARPADRVDSPRLSVGSRPRPLQSASVGVSVSSEARESGRSSSMTSILGSLTSTLTWQSPVGNSNNPMIRGARDFVSGPSAAQGGDNIWSRGLRGLRNLTGDVVRSAGNFAGFVTRNITGSPESAQRVRESANALAGWVDPRPPAPPRQPDGGAAARRANGVPEELDRHDYGPPVAPAARDEIANDIDPRTGRPRIGLLRETTDGNGHRYEVRNPLPPGTTLEQANLLLNRFNAPTTEALYGNGNDPTARTGSVDPRSILGNQTPVISSVLGLANRAGLLEPFQDMGGDVTLNRGRTPDGRAWVVNSTIRDRHPLAGHITRTVEEYNGQLYLRTVGVGQGDDGVFGARHWVNNFIGPSSFTHLDQRAYRAAERLQRGETLE